MSKAEQEVANEQAKLYEKQELIVEQILAWYTATAPDKRLRTPTVLEVGKYMLNLSGSDLHKGMQMAIARALRDIGFERQRQMLYGVRHYRFVAPDRIMGIVSERQTPTGTTLAAVPATGAGN